VSRSPTAKAEHTVRQRARNCAADWLARAYAEEYQDRYQQALERVHAQAPGLPSWRARERAGRHARAALQARYPEEYAARYQAELATIQPDEPAEVGIVAPQELGEVDRETATRARLRALLWLADLFPDLTQQRFQAEAARLPLRPADRVPGRRQALAWARTLDGLRGLFPEEFQARYTVELAGQAGPEPAP
jgi:hypothetical protein